MPLSTDRQYQNSTRDKQLAVPAVPAVPDATSDPGCHPQAGRLRRGSLWVMGFQCGRAVQTKPTE